MSRSHIQTLMEAELPCRTLTSNYLEQSGAQWLGKQHIFKSEVDRSTPVPQSLQDTSPSSESFHMFDGVERF